MTNQTNGKTTEDIQKWMGKKHELDNRAVYNRDEMEVWLADAEALHGYFSPSDKEASNVEFEEDETEPEWYRELRKKVQQIELGAVQEALSELQISEQAQLQELRNMHNAPKD